MNIYPLELGLQEDCPYGDITTELLEIEDQGRLRLKGVIIMKFPCIVLLCFSYVRILFQLGKLPSYTSTEVIVFHANSLNGPFRRSPKLLKNFIQKSKVILEGSGSREAARKVTELNRPCDIVASADYETIDSLMKPEFAKFNVFCKK